MGDIRYDISTAGLTSVATSVRLHSTAARAQGMHAASAARASTELCGTADGVAAALSRLIAPRAGTGTKAASYGQGCADVLEQVALIVSTGDEEMSAEAQAASANVRPLDSPGSRG
ncbi:hypothetical protein [Nesterenkonia sp. K-15-9-6]|uniref:hypothetical protein n=1 Tax=Nesterenkonia sp. K-15-9-6 TaxID=3093918 RepID=UPI004043AA53